MLNSTWQCILKLVYPCTEPQIGDVGVLKIRGPHCMKCGKPLREESAEYCRDCQRAAFSYDRGRSLFLHKEPVSTAIYQFKFHNRRIYGTYFARELAKEYKQQIARWGITEIIPVPLHPKKRKKRGYNQAEIISRELGQILQIPVNTDCIFRIENTRPQKELNDKERRKNLRSAFAINKKWTPNGSVLIIDDIYTTGSTIDAMSRLLKKRGAEHVFFLTISVGQGD